MQYIVQYNSTDFNWYLRGTNWTGDLPRASVFDSIEEAKEAQVRAAKFNPKALTNSVIVEKD